MIFSLSITYLEGEMEMKNINEMVPFVEEQEFFIMPQVRIIGKEYRGKQDDDYNPIPDFWKEVLKDGFPPELGKLPCVIPDSMVGWTGNSYIAGIMCPADTPVPEGFDFRDLPASYVAKGEYGDDVHDVVRKLTSKGFITCYTELGWNAELYFNAEMENPPKKDSMPFWRWLVPCVKVDEM